MRTLAHHCAAIAIGILIATTNLLNAAEPAQTKITIGKETTFITEPLRPDGYPDYLAAINKRMSEGVTPENNAAVLLAKAFGPMILDEGIRDQTYKSLGIAPLPAEGDYLVSRTEMIRRWQAEQPARPQQVLEEQLDEQFYAASQRPWSAEEFPMVAEWVAVNKNPLQLAIDATKRSKCYWPYVLDGDDQERLLIAVLLPQVQESRELAVLLAVRAMHRANENDIDGAWQDILACHRLARKIADGFTLVEALVGFAIEEIATNAEVSLAHYGKISAVQAKRFQADLQQLPAMPRIVETIDKGERFAFLDIVVQLARQKDPGAVLDLITSLTSGSSSNRENKAKDNKAGALLESRIDWNVPLKIANEWYDRLVKVGRITDLRERHKAAKAFDEEMSKMMGEFNNRGRQLLEFFASPSMKEFTSPRIGKILIALLMPAIQAAYKAVDRTDLNREMAMVAFALAAYRADNGQYPQQLEAIVPEYLAQIPDDTFSPKPNPIRYRRDGDSYLLWSAFLNGIDDNGVSFDDDPPGDDWVVRPAPVKKK